MAAQKHPKERVASSPSDKAKAAVKQAPANEAGVSGMSPESLRKRPGPRPGAKTPELRLIISKAGEAPAPGEAELCAIRGMAESLIEATLFGRGA